MNSYTVCQGRKQSPQDTPPPHPTQQRWGVTGSPFEPWISCLALTPPLPQPPEGATARGQAVVTAWSPACRWSPSSHPSSKAAKYHSVLSRDGCPHGPGWHRTENTLRSEMRWGGKKQPTTNQLLGSRLTENVHFNWGSLIPFRNGGEKFGGWCTVPQQKLKTFAFDTHQTNALTFPGIPTCSLLRTQ